MKYSAYDLIGAIINNKNVIYINDNDKFIASYKKFNDSNGYLYLNSFDGYKEMQLSELVDYDALQNSINTLSEKGNFYITSKSKVLNTAE